MTQNQPLQYRAHLLPNGRELHRITIPQPIRRENELFVGDIIIAIVTQAAPDLRISGTVWVNPEPLDAGSAPQPVGVSFGGHNGYSARSVLARVEESPERAFNWLEEELTRRYECRVGGAILGFDLDIWRLNPHQNSLTTPPF